MKRADNSGTTRQIPRQKSRLAWSIPVHIVSFVQIEILEHRRGNGTNTGHYTYRKEAAMGGPVVVTSSSGQTAEIDIEFLTPKTGTYQTHDSSGDGSGTFVIGTDPLPPPDANLTPVDASLTTSASGSRGKPLKLIETITNHSGTTIGGELGATVEAGNGQQLAKTVASKVLQVRILPGASFSLALTCKLGKPGSYVLTAGATLQGQFLGAKGISVTVS